MQIDGMTALVTGANRGLGRHLAEQLRDRGAKVYAGARSVGSVNIQGVTPLQLDITDEASIAAAVVATGNISILINNAAIATGAGLISGDLSDVRREFDTNFFGTLSVVRAFAPQLAAQRGSYILNVLSVLSWLHLTDVGGYSASKSAAWSLTNIIRQELAAQGTRVGALHVGYMDTDLAKDIDQPKSDPADVARIALDGIAAGDAEILADEVSASVRRGLAGGVAALYPDFA